MKYLVIFPSLLTTGSAATLTTVNYASPANIETKNSKINYQTDLTDKNISELSQIEKLKEQNKIKDLDVENIPSFIKPDTILNTHYSTLIHAVDEKVDITTFSNSNIHKQTTLKTLLAEQVTLSQTSATYTEIRDHFVKTLPVKTTWEMVTDTSSSSHKCKLQTKSSTATPAPKSPDQCSYDWNILSIDLSDKISTLLTKTPATASPTLLEKFNKISTN